VKPSYLVVLCLTTMPAGVIFHYLSVWTYRGFFTELFRFLVVMDAGVALILLALLLGQPPGLDLEFVWKGIVAVGYAMVVFLISISVGDAIFLRRGLSW